MEQWHNINHTAHLTPDDILDIELIRLEAIAELHSPFVYKCICMADIETGWRLRDKIDNEWLEFGREFREYRYHPCTRNTEVCASHNFPNTNIGFDEIS